MWIASLPVVEKTDKLIRQKDYMLNLEMFSNTEMYGFNLVVAQWDSNIYTNKNSILGYMHNVCYC